MKKVRPQAFLHFLPFVPGAFGAFAVPSIRSPQVRLVKGMALKSADKKSLMLRRPTHTERRKKEITNLNTKEGQGEGSLVAHSDRKHAELAWSRG